MSVVAEITQSWAGGVDRHCRCRCWSLSCSSTAQRHFGARVAYALWALPALRMLLPCVPG